MVDGIDFSLVRLDGFVTLVGTRGRGIAVLDEFIVNLVLNSVDRQFFVQRRCEVFNLFGDSLGEPLFVDAAR